MSGSRQAGGTAGQGAAAGGEQGAGGTAGADAAGPAGDGAKPPPPRRQGPWVLADQVVVSGANFLIGILLARQLGPEAFGSYVLLQAVLLYVNSFQGALIFQPLLSLVPQLPDGPRRSYLEGANALQWLLAMGLAAAILLAALLAHALLAWVPMSGQLGAVDFATAGALAAAVFAFQLQEWQRRQFFLADQACGALLLDVLAYGVQLTLLALAARQGWLDVGTAFFILAVAGLLARLAGQAALPLAADFAAMRLVLRRSWRNSRDYLVAWQFQWIGSQGVLVVGAGLIGAEAAGGVRAAQNIVGPVNLLFQAMENVVPITAARRHAAGGLDELAAYLWRITAWGSALLLPLLLALGIWAAPLTRLVYGDHYVAYAGLVAWQALAIFLQFYLRQLFFFLRTVHATGAILRAGVVMAVTSVLVALLTVHEHHATGVMLSFVAGYAVALLHALDAVRRICAAGGALAEGDAAGDAAEDAAGDAGAPASRTAGGNAAGTAAR